eukprot:2039527-Pyramimonas_sp.AAC.1
MLAAATRRLRNSVALGRAISAERIAAWAMRRAERSRGPPTRGRSSSPPNGRCLWRVCISRLA